MHEVLERIAATSPTMAAEEQPSHELGRLTDRSAELLRSTGLVRLLQPKEFSGYEAHPNDFYEAVIAVGRAAPAAGWIAGVVGVHPWEIALMDHRLQEEIWGDDPDTWTASPYAPFGRAKPVDGGFLLSGQWPYSTGTDHSKWVILGGMVVEPDGKPTRPPDVRHFVLPRSDYEIVEGSWNVMGLQGTGSKDVRMTDAFVPSYRVVEGAKMHSGFYESRQPDKPLYRVGFGLMFCGAICASTLGIAEAALNAYREYAVDRVTLRGVANKADPHQLSAYGAAASDIAASRAHLLWNAAELFDFVSKGGELTVTQRIEFRRDEVRASRRAVDAIDDLFKMAGSRAIWATNPLQQFWRDLHTAHSHFCNVAEYVYEAWAQDDFGETPAGSW